MLCTIQFIILQEIKIQNFQIRSIIILWSYKNVCPSQILGGGTYDSGHLDSLTCKLQWYGNLKVLNYSICGYNTKVSHGSHVVSHALPQKVNVYHRLIVTKVYMQAVMDLMVSLLKQKGCENFGKKKESLCSSCLRQYCPTPLI